MKSSLRLIYTAGFCFRAPYIRLERDSRRRSCTIKFKNNVRIDDGKTFKSFMIREKALILSDSE